MENMEPLGDTVSRTGSKVPMWLGRENICFTQWLQICLSLSCYVALFNGIGSVWCYCNNGLLCLTLPGYCKSIGQQREWDRYCCCLQRSLSTRNFLKNCCISNHWKPKFLHILNVVIKIQSCNMLLPSNRKYTLILFLPPGIQMTMGCFHIWLVSWIYDDGWLNL